MSHSTTRLTLPTLGEGSDFGSTPCQVMGILNITPDSFSDGGRQHPHCFHGPTPAAPTSARHRTQFCAGASARNALRPPPRFAFDERIPAGSRRIVGTRSGGGD